MSAVAYKSGDKMKLAGKIALVTGASRGIGRGIAIVLGENGCNVAVNFNASKDAALETASIIKANGTDSMVVRANVSDYDEVGSMVSEVVKRFGRIDILVCNAGQPQRGNFPALTPDIWKKTIELHLGGTYNCMKHVLPIMTASKWGRIIAMSSVAGITGGVGGAAYAASKAGIIGMVKSIAKEAAPFGITINVVAPGPIATETFLKVPQSTLDKIVSETPAGRMGEPKEVGHAIAFLSSDEASFITGQTLIIDGGRVMR